MSKMTAPKTPNMRVSISPSLALGAVPRGLAGRRRDGPAPCGSSRPAPGPSVTLPSDSTCRGKRTFLRGRNRTFSFGRYMATSDNGDYVNSTSARTAETKLTWSGRISDPGCLGLKEDVACQIDL